MKTAVDGRYRIFRVSPLAILDLFTGDTMNRTHLGNGLRDGVRLVDVCLNDAKDLLLLVEHSTYKLVKAGEDIPFHRDLHMIRVGP
jgi:hypothetical protein